MTATPSSHGHVFPAGGRSVPAPSANGLLSVCERFCSPAVCLFPNEADGCHPVKGPTAGMAQPKEQQGPSCHPTSSKERSSVLAEWECPHSPEEPHRAPSVWFWGPPVVQLASSLSGPWSSLRQNSTEPLNRRPAASTQRANTPGHRLPLPSPKGAYLRPLPSKSLVSGTPIAPPRGGP